MKQINFFTLKVLAISLIVGFSACNKEDAGPSQAEEDEQIIQDFIADNALDAEPTGSGLYIVINEEGSGVNPTLYDEVAVFYRGYLPTGEVFDLSGPEPAVFQLSSVIEGWQEGIPYFKPGGSGILLIPSHLGYGNRAVGNIPPNSVLIFDIELVRVN